MRSRCAVTESRIELDQVASVLVARGYQEVVTYSFIDAETQSKKFTGSDTELILTNPISSEMSTMRGSLVAGHGDSLPQANVARQQERAFVFSKWASHFHGTQDKPDRDCPCCRSGAW